jgi:hypothetical protein
MILLGHKKLEGMAIGNRVLKNPTIDTIGRFLQVEVHQSNGDCIGVVIIGEVGDMAGIIRLQYSGIGVRTWEILTPIGEIRTLQGVQTCINTLLIGVINK